MGVGGLTDPRYKNTINPYRKTNNTGGGESEDVKYGHHRITRPDLMFQSLSQNIQISLGKLITGT